MNVNKKYIICTIVLIVVSFIVSSLITAKTTHGQLQTISAIDTLSDSIVFANVNDDSISIVEADYNGNEVSSIQYPLKQTINGNYVYNYCLDLLTVDSSVYVHMVTLNGSNGTIYKERVLLCDFDSNSLKEAWNVPTDSTDFEQSAYGSTIIEDDLYYISYNEDDTVNFNMVDSNGNYSLIETIPLQGYNVIDWSILEDLTVVGYSSYQGIVKYQKGSVNRVYPLEDSKTSIVNFDSNGKDAIYCTDLSTNQNIVISLKDSSYTSTDYTNTLECNLVNSKSLDTVETSSLKKVSHIDSNSFVAVCDYYSEHDTISVYYNDTLNLIDSINFNSIHFGKMLKYALIVFLVLGAISFGIVWYIRRNEYFSITVKITTYATIIVLCGIVLIVNSIKTVLCDSFKDSIYSTLLYNASNISSSVQDALSYGYDYDTINDTISLENFYDLKDRNVRTNNLVMSPYYILHIQNSDGTLTTTNNSKELENVPTQYIYSNSTVEKYLESIDTNTPIMMVQKDSLGQWYVLAYPIEVYSFNEDTQSEELLLHAILEVGIEDYIVNYYVDIYSNRLTILLTASLLVLIVVSMSILWKFLKPLKKLSTSIKNGTCYPTKGTTFNDEVSEIKGTFEHMIANITNYKKDMQDDNETYQKFIPFRLFGLLGRQDISQLNIKCYRKTLLYTIHIDYSLNTKECYSNLISTIEANGGIVESFNNHSMEVVFDGDLNTMLNTTIKLVKEYQDIYIGIGYGVSTISIVGGEHRLEAMTISKQKSVAEKLSNLGKQFGIGILISDELLKRTSNLNVRLLGIINVDSQNVKVYQLIEDVNSNQDIVSNKQAFQTGVEHFLNGDYAIAKQYFVKVLKHSRYDTIAKEYLNRCDNYISNPNTARTDILSTEE